MAAVLSLAIPGLFYWISPAARRYASSDLTGYWSAARIFLDGRNPYDAATVLELQRSIGRQDPHPLIMWSPPWAHAYTLPLGLMPFPVARLTWTAGHLVILIVTADWIWRRFGGSLSSRPAAWMIAVTFVPSAVTLNLGQISILLLAGMVSFLAALHRGRSFIAGAAASLSALKPHVLFLFGIVLLLWVLDGRRWRLLAGAFAGLAAPALLVYLLNPEIYGHYLATLRSEFGPLRWRTASLGTTLRTAFPAAGAWLQFLPTSVGLLLGMAYWRRQKAGFDWQADLVPLALASTVAAAYVWTFDWVVLLPVVLLVLLRFSQDPLQYLSPLLALVLLQALLVVPLYNKAHYPATFWFPAAVAIVYMLSLRPGEQVHRVHPF
ncbi:MAG: DUF2029 domain-containing protein [Acidobacteria bacterium]|nr:DUF2029 domain-containing protein [Acidobacteriota bacterium]